MTQVKLKNKISKERVSKEIYESYELYFEILEFINMNFIDILNYLGDEKFSNELSQLVMKSSEVEEDFNSSEDNYKFNEKTIDI